MYKKHLQHWVLCGKDIHVGQNVVQYTGKGVSLELGHAHSGRVSKNSGRSPSSGILLDYSGFYCCSLCIGLVTSLMARVF